MFPACPQEKWKQAKIDFKKYKVVVWGHWQAISKVKFAVGA
jgi:hypothetical protein